MPELPGRRLGFLKDAHNWKKWCPAAAPIRLQEAPRDVADPQKNRTRVPGQTFYERSLAISPRGAIVPAERLRAA
jgi:hypothetical protein